VLIIDEAQGLSPHLLEEIRLHSNFESDTAKQLQIVLTGQPELREVLKEACEMTARLEQGLNE
jgi:general secretion pathway protein A